MPICSMVLFSAKIFTRRSGSAFPRGTRANQKHVPAKFHNDRILLQVQRWFSTGWDSHSRRSKKDKTALRLCFGQAFNLDEAYEFLENLSLPGSRSDKGIFSQRPCKHTAYLACPRQDQKSNEDVHIQLFRENSWDWEIRGSSWNANPRTWRRMT